jgi:hypothetical protein
VQISFKRWLGVEQSQFDRATVQAWDGSAWQNRLDESQRRPSTTPPWQSVSYDVTPYAAGRSDFRVRLRADVRPGGHLLRLEHRRSLHHQRIRAAELRSGIVRRGCTPPAPISGPSVMKPGGITTLSWTPSAGACHDASGAGYRVYRAPSPRPRVPSPAAWPGDSYFTDVTTRDLDGSAANASYQDGESPLAGFAFFYLVVDMGTNGAEGPKSWQGF